VWECGKGQTDPQMEVQIHYTSAMPHAKCNNINDIYLWHHQETTSEELAEKELGNMPHNIPVYKKTRKL